MFSQYSVTFLSVLVLNCLTYWGNTRQLLKATKKTTKTTKIHRLPTTNCSKVERGEEGGGVAWLGGQLNISRVIFTRKTQIAKAIVVFRNEEKTLSRIITQSKIIETADYS